MLTASLENQITKDHYSQKYIFNPPFVARPVFHFDIKFNSKGDGCIHIIAAKNLLKEESFPQWHGFHLPLPNSTHK